MDIGATCDGELIRIVQATGSGDAFERLLSNYSGALYRWTAPYRGYVHDREELMQEARLGFLAAVRGYDPTKSSFYSFAQLCVVRRLMSAARSSVRMKAAVRGFTIPLRYGADGQDDNRDPIETIADTTAIDPAESVERLEECRRIWSVAKTALTPLELEAMSWIANGLSYREAAAAIGVTAKGVDNAVARARRKLRELLSLELKRDGIA
ncbi:MAG: sigma-70 family RNA polymerase sigma factor [Clostridia bacterium]|nr:sigma-70 family RNA polymerase sigma factor [Clostridia bacterium]